MNLFLRRYTHALTVKIHSTGLVLPIHGIPVHLNIDENSSIESIYDSLRSYNEVKILTLDGITIGKTTALRELLGASFLISIGKDHYRVVQSSMETSLESIGFLLDFHEIHANKKFFIHQYLRKYEKIMETADSFPKDQLAQYVHNMIVQRKDTEREMDAVELKKRIGECFNEIKKMKPEYEELSRKANNIALGYLWGGFGIAVAEMLYVGSGTYYFYSWDIMEAQAYLIGLGNLIVGLYGTNKYKIAFSMTPVYLSYYQSKLKKIAFDSNFNLERYEALCEELKRLQRKITLDDHPIESS